MHKKTFGIAILVVIVALGGVTLFFSSKPAHSREGATCNVDLGGLGGVGSPRYTYLDGGGYQVTVASTTGKTTYQIPVRTTSAPRWDQSATRMSIQGDFCNKAGVYVVDFSKGTATLIAPITLSDNDDATISPDGRLISYVQGGVLRVAKVDGKADHVAFDKSRLSPNAVEIQWSSDSSMLMIDAPLTVVKIDGTIVHQYKTTAFAPSTYPTLSYDGKSVAYIDGMDAQTTVYLADLAGHVTKSIPIRKAAYWLSWARNGHSLAVFIPQTESDVVGTCDIDIIDLNSGGIQVLSNDAECRIDPPYQTPQWSSDSSSILYQSAADRTFVLRSVASGAKTQVGVVPDSMTFAMPNWVN